MSELVLRPFAWGDVPAITEIYRHYVDTSVVTFDTEAPNQFRMAEKFGALMEQGFPVIVAERDGQLIGYAYSGLFRPRFAYRFTCEDSLYLHPDHTGKGYGKQLLERLIADSRIFGFKQMIAVITQGTGNSIALHEKYGFRHIGQFPALGLKFDRWLDVVYMQLEL